MRRIIYRTIPALGLAALLAGCGERQGAGGTGTDQTSGSTDQSAKKADDTGVNKRDRSGDTLTPGDQGNNDSDRELARNVRRAIVKNDQLSTTAKNIKIIASGGKVTLRGPVKSEAEKNQIASIAQGVQGASSVDNQLEIKQASATEPKGE
jgi:osmotically-inducible protein OsmY